MNLIVKISAIASALALLVLSCQDFSLIKDEKKDSKTSQQTDETDNDDFLDASDVGGETCNDGDRKAVSCNSCVCEKNSWSCTEKGCVDATGDDDFYAEDGEDQMGCDALGVTWRFKEGGCFLEEWSGCGPRGVSFANQKECLQKNSLTKELQWLPIGAGCQLFYAGSQDLIQESDCLTDTLIEGMTCTGYGGPGCSGEDCKTMEKTACKTGGKVLACRPVDFVCSKGS